MPAPGRSCPSSYGPAASLFAVLVGLAAGLPARASFARDPAAAPEPYDAYDADWGYPIGGGPQSDGPHRAARPPEVRTHRLLGVFGYGLRSRTIASRVGFTHSPVEYGADLGVWGCGFGTQFGDADGAIEPSSRTAGELRLGHGTAGLLAEFDLAVAYGGRLELAETHGLFLRAGTRLRGDTTGNADLLLLELPVLEGGYQLVDAGPLLVELRAHGGFVPYGRYTPDEGLDGNPLGELWTSGWSVAAGYDSLYLEAGYTDVVDPATGYAEVRIIEGTLCSALGESESLVVRQGRFTYGLPGRSVSVLVTRP